MRNHIPLGKHCRESLVELIGVRHIVTVDGLVEPFEDSLEPVLDAGLEG